MTKEELLIKIDYILTELYRFIDEDDVNKNYLPALKELVKIVKESKEKSVY